MGLWKTTKSALGAARSGLRIAADGVHGVSVFAKRHESAVTIVARGSLRVVTTAVELGGAGIAKIGVAGAEAAQRSAAATDNRLARGALTAARYAGQLVGVAGIGIEKTGEIATRVAPTAGYLAGGVVTGATGAVSGTLDSVAITDNDIAALRRELEEYGRILCDRADARLAEIRSAQRQNRKTDLLDTLVVGGVSLADIVHAPSHVPPVVERAFELQYPDLATSETFAQAVHHASSDQLLGLVNGVKGKLFELSLLDHLNTPGQLPDGWEAVLAPGATHPGWDLQVLDSHGHVANLIQAKATDSIDYIRQALDHYPNIDITATSEVYSRMAAMGLAQHVHDGGVALSTLNGDMVGAVADASSQFHVSFVPSAIGLAVIALSVLMNKRLTREMAAREFGQRSAKSGIAVGAASAAMVVTQTWWIGLLAGVGTRLLTARGEAKREQYQMLKDAVGTLRPLMLAPAVAH